MNQIKAIGFDLMNTLVVMNRSTITESLYGLTRSLQVNGFSLDHSAFYEAYKKGKIIFVGDDIEADMMGAIQVGLQPVWSTYARDHHIAFAPPILMSNTEKLDFDGPRISTWDDLLRFLDIWII